MASPGFSIEEKVLLKHYEEALESAGYIVFSPFRDAPVVDFKIKENRKKIYEANAKAIEEADWIVVNLDFTTIAGKYPIPIPDTGTVWEIGMASGLRRYRESSGSIISCPNIIAITSSQAWGINIMLEHSVQGFVSGIDRFFEALNKHKDLKVFLDKYDDPLNKNFVIY